MLFKPYFLHYQKTETKVSQNPYTIPELHFNSTEKKIDIHLYTLN